MKAGTDFYYFDTYALVEINKGNPNYQKYLDSRLITSILNLMEFYHMLVREGNKEIAEIKFDKYLKSCVRLTPVVIKEAVEFRLHFIKETKFKISYVDAVGYVIAKKLGVKFLTGNESFRKVEFAK